MQIFDCEQGTPEWYAARLGIPTSSEFKTLLSGTKDAKDKKTRATYLRKLAGEVITGKPMESYTNVHMERGREMEDEARIEYAFATGFEPVRVGFLRAENCGCSPDSLIGNEGGLEIKTALPHIQIERLEDGRLPSEHKAQVHGNIWVSGRKWWDFVSYCPGLPLFIVRVPRDEDFNAEIAAAVNDFNADLDALVTRIRNYAPKAIAA